MKPSDSPVRREVGVDVAKDHLDVSGGTSHWQVPNNRAGIRRLPGRLKKTGPHYL